jgi:hypothetical protein
MDPAEYIDEFIENTYGDAPYGLEDLLLIRTLSCAVGLPAGSPERLKRYVMAAVQTYHIGNKSVDHVLKTYSKGWKLDEIVPPVQALISRACSIAKTGTRDAHRRLHVFYKPAHCGTTSAWAALLRLQATIRSIVFTIRQAFHFETACLLRLYLEQLAWISAVYSLDDIDAIFATEPRKCISTLKRLFAGAGFVYGYLSEKAHLTPEQTTRYITSESGQLSASMVVRDYARLDAYVLLTLSDWYIVLCDLTLSQHTDVSESAVVRRETGWEPDPDRPFLKTLQEFKVLLEVTTKDMETAV